MILETLCIGLFSFYNGKILRLLYQWSVVFLTHHLLQELPDGDYYYPDKEEVLEEEDEDAATNPASKQAYDKHDHDAVVVEDCLGLYQRLQLPDLDGESEASSSTSQPSQKNPQPGERRRVAFQNVTIRQFRAVAAERSFARFHNTQPSKASARLSSKQQNALLRATKIHSTRAAEAATTIRDDWSVVVVSETTVTVDEFEQSKQRSHHDSSFRSVSHTVSKNKKSTKQKYKNTTKKMNKKKKKKKSEEAVQVMASCGARPFVLEQERLITTSASTMSNRHRDKQRPTSSSVPSWQSLENK